MYANYIYNANYIYKRQWEFYLLLFSDFLCSAGIPHSSPGNSRCGDLFRVYDFVRFLFSNGIGAHRANPIMKPMRRSVPKTPRSPAEQFHPNFIHKASRLKRVGSPRGPIARAIRIRRDELFFFRALWNDRHGACDSQRGTNRLEWTTKSILAAIGSDVVVAPFDYSRLPVRERTLSVLSRCPSRLCARCASVRIQSRQVGSI